MTLTEYIRDRPPFDRDLGQEFLDVLSSRSEYTILRHNKFMVRAEHLTRLDEFAEEQISLNNNLWDIDCAV